jgi:epsilon-lactone hydrolase
MMQARIIAVVLATTLILTASTSALSDEPLDQVIAAYKQAAARLANAKNVEDWRASIADGTEKLIAVDDDIKVLPVDAGGVSAEWVIPPNVNADRVLMYLHGGGYIMCSARFHRGLVARLARAAGVKALNVDYRLAPEHPYPAAVNDATAAYRWLISQDVKPDHIVMAGDSAGGGLTLATLVHLRDTGVPLPSAAICISPWVDLAMTGHTMSTNSKADPYVQKEQLLFMARNYLRDTDPRTPLASPLYADLRGLPPLLIHVGSAETLLSDATRIAERAGSADVNVTLEIWKDMVHGWHIFAPILPDGQKAIDRVGDFIKTNIR